jgi:VWFA-related protein
MTLICSYCRVICLLSVALLSVGGSGAWAQQPKENQPYTIQQTVRRVVLDVVVTDSHHHAVPGLKPWDFEVSEEHKPQAVLSFEAFSFDAASKPTAPRRLRPLPPDTYMNVETEGERGPLYVIVYDAVHMREEDQPRARQELAAFLAAKPAGTRFALFLLAGELRLLQGFTADPKQLLASFDTHRKDGHIPQVFLMGMNFGADDTDLPFEVMSYIGRFLEGLPGRKNLIWLSSEFPMSAALVLPQVQATVVGNAMAPTSASPLQAQGFDGVTSTPVDKSRSQRIMKQAIDTLNAAQVSVYPVNVGGLRPDLTGVDVIADRIASVTGGRAYYNTNDFRGAMEDAAENGASYYEISYAPSDSTQDGRIRRIEVSLDRKGMTLEYRRYYYAEDPNAPLTKDEKEAALETADVVAAHQPGDPMYAWMQHGAPIDHDILFQAQIHSGPAATVTPEQMATMANQSGYFAVRTKGKPAKPTESVPVQEYTIDYVVLDPSTAHAQGTVLELAAAAYDRVGNMLSSLSQNAVRTQAPPDAKTDPFFRAKQTLDVPTTAAWLQIGVRDVNTHRIGTMEVALPLAGAGPAGARAATQPVTPVDPSAH